MIERSKEDIQKIVEKWSYLLNAPLSGNKTAMLIESQEKTYTLDQVIESIEDKVFKQYVENFKHDNDHYNPDGYISVLVKHHINKHNINL